jgi:hypothetical protein
VINKRTDPDYKKLSGYIPKDLWIELKQHLTKKELQLNDGLEEAVRVYLEQEKKESSSSEKEPVPPLTIAWLIQGWELDELSNRSGISTERLEHYRDGERPTDTDLVQMHNLFEDPEDGHLLCTEELMDLRRRTFNTKRRQTNGV